MKIFGNALGTLSNLFRVAKGRIDTSPLTAVRTLRYQDTTIEYFNGTTWLNLAAGGSSTAKNYIAVFGGAGSSSVGVGTTCFVAAVEAGTVLNWKLISPSSVTCVVNVWKVNGSIPTSGNLISNALPPTLTTATVASSTNLKGWTNTTVAVGDVFGFSLDSLTETTNSITLSLEVG